MQLQHVIEKQQFEVMHDKMLDEFFMLKNLRHKTICLIIGVDEIMLQKTMFGVIIEIFISEE
jgi:hypothetical protein